MSQPPGRRPGAVATAHPVAAAALCFVALASAAAAQVEHHPAPDVRIRRLAGDVWLHTSARGPRVSNGLVVATAEGSLLVNTAPTVEQTRAILQWVAQSLPKPVRLAIITGADPDRMGGLAALVEAQVPVHATERTAERARHSPLGWTRDHYGFEAEKRIRAGEYSLQLFSPGDGATPDDLVVWIPEAQVLFGGRLIRGEAEHSLGPVPAPVLGAWAAALRRTRSRYPEARWVVPADGDAGGIRLLDHTLDLLRRAGAR